MEGTADKSPVPGLIGVKSRRVEVSGTWRRSRGDLQQLDARQGGDHRERKGWSRVQEHTSIAEQTVSHPVSHGCARRQLHFDCKAHSGRAGRVAGDGRDTVVVMLGKGEVREELGRQVTGDIGSCLVAVLIEGVSQSGG